MPLTPQQENRRVQIEKNIRESFSPQAIAILTPGESHHIERYARLCAIYPGLTQPLIMHFKASIELRSQIPLDLFYDIIELYRLNPESLKPIEAIVKESLKPGNVKKLLENGVEYDD